MLRRPKRVQSGHPDNAVKPVGGTGFGARLGAADQTFGEGFGKFLPGARDRGKDFLLGYRFLRGVDLGRDKEWVDPQWVGENL